MPPIQELLRPAPIYLQRLERNGIFTTGLLLEVSETPTRRQYLADQLGATINDVSAWRDEAHLLNLAGVGTTEHTLFLQAGIQGLSDVLALDREALRYRVIRAARLVGVEAPADLVIDGWWEQAHTLEEG